MSNTGGTASILARKRRAGSESDGVTKVEIHTDILTRVEDGDITANELLVYVSNNVTGWIEKAKDEAIAAKLETTPKRVRVMMPGYRVGVSDFRDDQFERKLIEANDHLTEDQLVISRGRVLRHRGHNWCVLGWKNLGIMVPLIITPILQAFIKDFIREYTDHFVWDLQMVLDLFRLGKVIPTFRFDSKSLTSESVDSRRKTGETCGWTKFDVVLQVSPAQQNELFVSIDNKCYQWSVGDRDEVGFWDIVGRVCAVMEVIEPELDWDLAFDRTDQQIYARADEIQHDQAALEAVLGPKDEWIIGDDN